MHAQFGDQIIEWPQRVMGDMNIIVGDMYGNISETILTDEIVYSLILAPSNVECLLTNDNIVNCIPGDKKSLL